jgi:hypothetical protein
MRLEFMMRFEGIPFRKAVVAAVLLTDRNSDSKNSQPTLLLDPTSREISLGY